jgi:hypothetical protein
MGRICCLATGRSRNTPVAATLIATAMPAEIRYFIFIALYFQIAFSRFFGSQPRKQSAYLAICQALALAAVMAITKLSISGSEKSVPAKDQQSKRFRCAL